MTPWTVVTHGWYHSAVASSTRFSLASTEATDYFIQLYLVHTMWLELMQPGHSVSAWLLFILQVQSSFHICFTPCLFFVLTCVNFYQADRSKVELETVFTLFIDCRKNQSKPSCSLPQFVYMLIQLRIAFCSVL